MSSLYELAGELREAEAALEEAEDQDLNAQLAQDLIAEWLSNVERDVDAKLDGMCRWLANTEAEAEAFDAEIKTLRAKREQRANLGKSLRNHMRDFLKAVGRTKFKGLRTLSILAGRKSVEVDESRILEWPADAFDAALAAGAIEYVPKLKSKTALKTVPGWESLPGVSEITGEDSIRIA